MKPPANKNNTGNTSIPAAWSTAAPTRPPSPNATLSANAPIRGQQREDRSYKSYRSYRSYKSYKSYRFSPNAPIWNRQRGIAASLASALISLFQTSRRGRQRSQWPRRTATLLPTALPRLLLFLFLPLLFFSSSSIAFADTTPASPDETAASERRLQTTLETFPNEGMLKTSPFDFTPREPAPGDVSAPEKTSPLFSKFNFRDLFQFLPYHVEQIRNYAALPVAFILLSLAIILRMQQARDSRSFLFAIIIPMAFTIAAIASGRISSGLWDGGKVLSEKITSGTSAATVEKMLLFGSALMPTAKWELMFSDPLMPASLRAAVEENLAGLPPEKASELRRQINESRAAYISWTLAAEALAAGNETFVVKTSAGEVSVTDPAECEQQIKDAVKKLNNLLAENQLADPVMEESRGWKDKLLDSVDFLSSAAIGFLKMLIFGVAFLMVMLAAALIIIVYVFLCFFIALSHAFLPAFIAALAIPKTAQIGWAYCMRHFSMCLWPAGWALGHLATPVILEHVVETLSDGAGTVASASAAADAGFYQNLQRISQKAILAPFSFGLTTLLLCFLMMAYVVFVTIFMPRLVNRVLGVGGVFASAGAGNFMDAPGGNAQASGGGGGLPVAGGASGAGGYGGAGMGGGGMGGHGGGRAGVGGGAGGGFGGSGGGSGGGGGGSASGGRGAGGGGGAGGGRFDRSPLSGTSPAAPGAASGSAEMRAQANFAAKYGAKSNPPPVE